MSYLRTRSPRRLEVNETRDLGSAGGWARIQSTAEEVEYAGVDLAIVCESTYPYRKGGLSAVVHQICQGSPHLRIGIIHITWDSSFPRTDVFGMPDNVAWVMPVYQSMLEHKDGFQDLTVADLQMSPRQQRALVDRLFAALHAHLLGDDEPLWSLYDEGVNSLTRRFNIWPILFTEPFMCRALQDFGASKERRSELFWWLREFFSLAYAVTTPTFPRAALYHAHTTGAAGLLAATAARQHETSFLLTEHNLYVRDSVNHMLGRSMDCVVSLDDWKELSTYRTRMGVERQVTSRERYWMQWFSRLGVIAYRAADRITYLYPEAIEEAAGLGGKPEKSIVVPNGLDPSPFRSARAVFRERDGLRRDSGYVWRLAHVGRVVPIKGLTDLLESLHALRARGLDGFVLDVMGPDDEFPEYVDLCHARVAELGLSEHVRFRGSVDLPAELGEYDMLLMPSHNEGLPIAILEAMAVGLPVIATDVGGVRGVVTGGAAGAESKGLDPGGIVIQPHDKAAMTESIQIVLRDPELFDKYSCNALARIQARYRMELTLARYHGVFDQLGAPSQESRAASA